MERIDQIIAFHEKDYRNVASNEAVAIKELDNRIKELETIVGELVDELKAKI